MSSSATLGRRRSARPDQPSLFAPGPSPATVAVWTGCVVALAAPRYGARTRERRHPSAYRYVRKVGGRRRLSVASAAASL